MELMYKPIVFICIIFLAAILKKAGLFQNSDSKQLSKIIMNFTLPAAIISSFVNYKPDTSLILLIPIGLLCSLIPLLLIFPFTKKMSIKDRIFYMINLGGYNIGNFTLPIATSFFGAPGIIVCVMFDIGNAIMMVGGSYTVTSSLLHLNKNEKSTSITTNIKSMAKSFFSSFLLIVYLVMIIFLIFHVQMPEVIATILSPIASANAFLSMFMIGLMFQFTADKSFIKDIIRLPIIRILFSACISVILYFFAPFSLEIRQILSVIVFAPFGSIAPIFVEKAGGDIAKSGTANTVSIIVSFVIMIGLSSLYLA